MTLPQARQQAPVGACLIVEDSEFDSMRMARIVNKSLGPVPVHIAPTLDTARLLLRQSPTALILLDNNLPDGLGANFALELAQDSKFGQIPVIIVSDWPSPFMWDKAVTAGVRYVVSKMEFGSRHVRAALEPERGAKRSIN